MSPVINPGSGLQVLASTPPGGTALINGTQTIISATVPGSTGQVPVIVPASFYTTVAETGGAINITYTINGQAASSQATPGGSGVGTHTAGAVTIMADAGTTVSVVQASALTAGATQYSAAILAP